MSTASKASAQQTHESDPWVSVPDAAEMLGESKYKVLSRSRLGELETHVVAGRIFVHRDSISRVLRDRNAAAAGAR